MRLSMICVALVSVLIRPFGTSAASPDEEAGRLPLPRNITIHEAVRDAVEASAAVSPTLQRQLAVIRDADVRVDVRVSPAPLPGFRRAETRIGHYESGFIRAEVHVPPGVHFIELLAHELEHVVEQLEGLNLENLTRNGAAVQERHGIFETERAHAAGRAAAGEVLEGRRRTSPAP